MEWNKDNPRYKRPENYGARRRPRYRPRLWLWFKENLKKRLARRRTAGSGPSPALDIGLMTGLRQVDYSWRALSARLARALEILAGFSSLSARPLRLLVIGVMLIGLSWQGLKRFGPDTWPTPEPRPFEQPEGELAGWPEKLPPPPFVPPGPYENSALFWAGCKRQSLDVQAGESLSQVCDNLNLVGREQARFLKALSGVQKLNQVKPGTRLTTFRTSNGLVKIEFLTPNARRPKILIPTPGGDFRLVDPGAAPIPVTRAAQGLIEATLWDSALAAGLPPELIGQLADMFAYEVDFLADIKNGDRFQVLYEQKYQDGLPLGQAVIELAILETGGRRLELYRYLDQKGASGFYDLEGRSNIKNFFVTPLQYTRISSHYNLKRMHPILKRVRAHEGVDYAAPTGTPVVSVASGTVVSAGWKGGYGKLAVIRHGDAYVTMYAHLSGFAPGLKNGAHVAQGEIIGYVGSTGLSTGPHLDFRLKKNGQFVNPVVELAKQQPSKTLGGDDKIAFKLGARRKADKMIELLKSRS